MGQRESLIKVIFITIGAEFRTPARDGKHPRACDMGKAHPVTSPEGAKKKNVMRTQREGQGS